MNMKIFKSPLSIVWEITNSCNLKCSHCRSSVITPTKKIGNIDIENKIINDIIRNEIFVVNISGGEPLLNPRCIDIINTLSERGVHVGLFTNGILFPKYSDELKKAKLGYIQISLDGPENIHNKFRNSNTAYQSAITALKLAKSMGFKVQLNCVENMYNIEHLEYLYDFANYEGIEMHIRRFIPVGFGKENIDLLPNYSNHFKMLNTLAKMKKKSKVKISIESPLIHFLESSTEDSLIGCGAGITQLGIDESGNVYPCIFFRKFLGNMLKENLEEIWLKSDILNKIRHRDFEKCRNCHAKIICGGCQACAEEVFGEDPLCPLKYDKVSKEDIANVKNALRKRFL